LQFHFVVGIPVSLRANSLKPCPLQTYCRGPWLCCNSFYVRKHATVNRTRFLKLTCDWDISKKIKVVPVIGRMQQGT